MYCLNTQYPEITQRPDDTTHRQNPTPETLYSVSSVALSTSFNLVHTQGNGGGGSLESCYNYCIYQYYLSCYVTPTGKLYYVLGGTSMISPSDFQDENRSSKKNVNMLVWRTLLFLPNSLSLKNQKLFPRG